MRGLECELLCHSNSPHLQQVYTGYHLLEKQGYLRLHQRVDKKNIYDDRKPPHLRDARHAHLLVRLGNGIFLFYDTHDSHEIDKGALEQVDFYFKRSFLRGEFEDRRILPLGLNYPVVADGVDMRRLYRTLALESGPGRRMNLLKQILHREHIYLSRTQALPDFRQESRILFMVTSWDPREAPSPEKAAEREDINNMRAQCIRLLKKEFKDRFLGGFQHTEHARKNYPDCLLPDPALFRKKIFMRTMRTYPICVATSGLHASTGWKMAEYVAHSKAILSETLHYRPTGSFGPESHYLNFASAEECITQAVRLFESQPLRNRLMLNNYHYYQNHLRPDSLVLNTLAIALSESVQAEDFSDKSLSQARTSA
ncbi:hypothetical protein [Thermithiobacillus plumbiphilus]|uniref:Uncharacterized protein n=1 Tax=Thermithiobacillus plumbiphilus TaxID=1729899 RepID=A0ABU9D825_9PROT